MTAADDQGGPGIAGLLSPRGRQLLDRLAGEEVTPDRALRLSRSLRAQYPPALVAAGLTQQALRGAARGKFRRADRMLFTRSGLEQASSEHTARAAAGRYRGREFVADLCCGIGGNLLALGAGRRVLAVDRDLVSLSFARHNAEVYGAAAGLTVVCADVRDVRLTGVDAVFADPARRTGRGRLPPGASEPPLRWCVGLAQQVPAVGIKAAPGLPHESVPAGWEAEFVAVGRDLKEAMMWSPALATTNRRATVLPSGETMTHEPGAEVPVAPPGQFLLDPNPAVTRAGLVEELARRLGAWKIDPEIAFLSSDRPHNSPFARCLRILESAPWHERDFARRARALGVGAADIRRRGLAGDVGQIRRRLKLHGDRSAAIVMTRVGGRPWGLLCAGPGDCADAASG